MWQLERELLSRTELIKRLYVFFLPVSIKKKPNPRPSLHAHPTLNTLFVPFPFANEVLFHFSDIIFSVFPDHPLFCHINCSIHSKHRTSNAKMQRLWLWLRLLLLPWSAPHSTSRPAPRSRTVLLLGAVHAKQTIVGRRRRHLRNLVSKLQQNQLQPFFRLLSLHCTLLLASPQSCVALAIKANKLAKS